MALGSVAITGCSLVSLNGLSGGPADTGDAAGSDSLTVDARSEGASTDGSGAAEGAMDAGGDTIDPADVTHPADSAGITDSSTPMESATALDSAPAMDSSHPDSSGAVDSSPEAAVDAGSVYASTVLSDAPLAYWRVDETSGTVAHDITGHGNDGQYVGTVTLGAGGALVGDPDTAVHLDGATAYIDVGNRFGFTGNAAYTLEIWAEPQNLNVNYQRLFSRELQTTPREGYLLFVRAENAADPSTFSVERWATGATNQCPQTNAITQVWHHLVATYDGATSRVYVDGAVAATQPAPLALNTTTASLWIGASFFDTNGYFDGPIDEVAVYGTALSASRIAAHFHASGR